MEMSDTFELCKKCGEELYPSVLSRHYYCLNCNMTVHAEDVREVTTEYFKDKGEEDEQGNQSRRGTQ